MIQTIVAGTSEIDDVARSVEDIRLQLEAAGPLKKHTVGLLACHYEFVLSGVVRALNDALPFDVTGTITAAQAGHGEVGTLRLCLTVLTSDDVEFITALTPSLLENPADAIRKTYAAVAQKDTAPSLIFAFAPFMVENSGDDYVDVLSELSGGAPCFGTLAVDDTLDFSNCFLVHNGHHYRDHLALVLVYGEVKPRFFTATISMDKVLDRAALVTKSAGHILMELNDRPVAEYFENLGLTKASETSYAMTSLPFMLDYNDGTPWVSKVFIGLTPEKYAICAGTMPEGASLYIGVFDKRDVLTTTGAAADQIVEAIEGASGLLIYSCISRNMTLGSDQLAELDLFRDKIGDKVPFMMAYSGGELCPTQVTDGHAINRFHNNALIACVF
ncbi:MAG: FIST C-terminal domain-containing protein [Oscillospiraceae bacterium]|jgi:hypothetical protein|nr:FIST C-terminal domain-containing protein [Oscillospiraceae bacterium]